MKRLSLLLFVLFASSFCFGGEWFVAPNGNDINPGTQAQPFATLERAKIVVRQHRAAEVLKLLGEEMNKYSGDNSNTPLGDEGRAAAMQAIKQKPHTIRIAEGVYEFTEPFVLDERDSNTVYIGAGWNTVISGGRSLNGWKKESDEIWYVDLPQEDGRDWYFEQLFVNGRRATRARTPNNGFLRPQDVQQEIPMDTRNPQQQSVEQSIMPQKGDLDFLKTTPQAELRFGQCVIHHHWDTTRRILLGYDTENDLLLMKGEPMKHWNPWRTTSLYYIENVRAAFDEPGEWFYDGVNRKALYRPLPGEKLEESQFIVPRNGLNQLIILKGKPEQRATGIWFMDIKFAYTDSPRRKNLMQAAELDTSVTGDLNFPGPSQINPQQAAFWADAVIDVENAYDFAISNCEITNIGEYAIWIKNSEKCGIGYNVLTDLGAGGIRIGGVGSSKSNVVNQNIIHRGGRLHASAVGVWLGQGTEANSVSHNDIGDFYYTGVSMGWVWGYTGGVAFRNKITYNRIHDLGQGALADMGGIYTLGNCEGSVVAYNEIFNVKSYAYGGWGLYPDEGTEGLLMENNLVYDTTDGSFHQHYGKNNTVRNNILVNSTPHQVAVTRVEDHCSIIFEKNIIYWTEGSAIGYQTDAVQADFRNNLWWHADKEGNPLPVDFKGKPHEEWVKKDVGSIVADPKFVDPKNRDFRLQEDSPALKLGFEPFSFSAMGVCGSRNRIQRANDFVTPVHPTVQPIAPYRLVDGFETRRIEPVWKGTGSDEGKNLIRLTKEHPASGEQCLEIVYAPGLERSWNPHLYYQPNYEQGEARIAFSMRMQENAEVDIELRDGSSPYKVGPRFRVSKGKVQVDGMEIVVPVNEWIRYEIKTHIGDQSTGKWSLGWKVLSDPHVESATGNLDFHHADWRALTWFGFTSPAKSTDKTTYFLDDMEIGNGLPPFTFSIPHFR